MRSIDAITAPTERAGINQMRGRHAAQNTPFPRHQYPTQEVIEMNTTERNQNEGSNAPSNAPPTDTSGNTVNVVERDLDDASRETEGVDETITPSSTRVKEQDAEELNRKSAEIEREIVTPKVR